MFSFLMLEIDARDQPNVLKIFFESFYVKRSDNSIRQT